MKIHPACRVGLFFLPKPPRFPDDSAMTKKLRVRDAYEFLDAWAPASLAEDWDHVGLQLGSLKCELEGVLVALDVTERVLEEAKKKRCNLLITHHPLAFQDARKLPSASLPARLARQASRQGLSILSFHTNLDSTEQGLNDLLAQNLKLEGIRPLVKIPGAKKAGMGRLGCLRERTLRSFLSHVARCTGLAQFRYVGELSKPISQVAVVTGSGAGFFGEAKRKGADVLVTGDVKYHAALDALAEGIALVDIGHFAGEIGMTGLVAARLRGWLKGLQGRIPVHETRAQSDPLRFWPL